MRNPFPKITRHLDDAAHEIDDAVGSPIFLALAVIAVICLIAATFPHLP
jgi:hypothetical protein